MWNLSKIMIAVIFSLLFLYSGEVYSKAGKTSAAFLKIGVGPRALAMGGAFCAIADDATALYWNPAGLAQLKREELFVSRNILANDIKQDFIGWYGSLPFWNVLLGISVNYLTVGGIEKRAGPTPVPDDEVSASDGAIGLTYIWKLKPNLSLGVTPKFVWDRLDNDTAHSVAVDMGGLLKYEKFGFGAVLQNLRTKLGRSNLPRNLKLGLSCTPKPNLTLGIDYDYAPDNPERIHLGGEYWLGDKIAFRGGYEMKEGMEKLGFPAGLSLGAGYRTDNLQFDFAWLPYADLGNTYRFSGAYKWGAITKEPGTITPPSLPPIPTKPGTITPPPPPEPGTMSEKEKLEEKIKDLQDKIEAKKDEIKVQDNRINDLDHLWNIKEIDETKYLSLKAGYQIRSGELKRDLKKLEDGLESLLPEENK